MFKTMVHDLLASLTSWKNMSFYAVSSGRQVGIFPTWSECEQQVKGFPQAKYKKFLSKEEAEEFIRVNRFSLPESNFLVCSKASDNVLQKVPQKAPSMLSAASSSSPKPYYAVAKGVIPGVYSTWPECQKQIAGIKYPKFKKFFSLQEAQDFVNENGGGLKGAGRSSEMKTTKLIAAALLTSVRHLSTVTYCKQEFQRDEEGFVHVFTDGSCESNGSVKAKAGIGVWFGVDNPMNVSDPVKGPPTNNVAEIEAATKAIEVAKSCGIKKLQINTDSQFLIKCITQWLPKWRTNGWKVSSGGDVKNKEQLIDLYKVKRDIEVKWNYVKAHVGIEGNEHADVLAKAGAARFKMKSEDVRFKPY